MKAYVCDMCHEVIEHPHTLRMSVFTVSYSNCDEYQVGMNSKIRKKLHLCGHCLDTLCDIARGEARARKIKKGGAE